MADPDTPNTEQQPEAEEQFEAPLPPANFEWLVYSLDLGARMALGLIHFGEEKDAPKPDLKRAQHSIDMLAMLQEKTRGNLTLEEQRLIENSLTELRFRYVQVADELRAKS